MTKTDLRAELSRMKLEVSTNMPRLTPGRVRLLNKINHMVDYLYAGAVKKSVLLLFHKEITKDFNEVKEKVKLC